MLRYIEYSSRLYQRSINLPIYYYVAEDCVQHRGGKKEEILADKWKEEARIAGY